MAKRTDDRAYDLVIYGATGFTGRLVAEYLAGKRPEGLRWAIAGRSKSKLEGVRTHLAQIHPDMDQLPLVVADSSDRASLEAMVGDAKVICTTVGPYAKYGSELVAACAAAGTHYCDLTGEVQWVRRMIDAHHEAAKASGARIVTCCGFDSIPSDIGTWMMVQESVKRFGAPPSKVTLYVAGMRGGASGGTVASLANVGVEAVEDPAVRELLLDPYCLVPERAGDPPGLSEHDLRLPRWDRDAGRWIGPFIMATVNARIVRRSNALLGDAYGRDFDYSEVIRFGKGPMGAAMAFGLAAGTGAMLGAMLLPPLRKLMERTLFPAPGEGPSREAMHQGFFKLELLARVPGSPELLRGRVVGNRDPGYGATSIMLAESALCLAQDDLTSPGGLLTPASAMGDALLDRLRAAGMTYEVA